MADSLYAKLTATGSTPTVRRPPPRPTSRTGGGGYRPGTLASLRQQASRSAASSGLPSLAERRSQRDRSDRIFDRLERQDNSFFGQVGNAIQASVTQGPALILKEGVGTIVGPARFAVDAISDPTKVGRRLAEGYANNGGGLRGVAGSVDAMTDEYAPLPAMMADSMENTAGFAANPIGEWNQAADEHRTADLIFETVGNAALVGGTAAKIIGRAPRAAQVANLTDARIVRGAGRATTVPRSLSAGTNAQRRAAMIRPMRESQAAVRRAAINPESVSSYLRPTTIPVTPRGTGLAGMARRRGADAVADRLDTVGQNVSKVTRLLDAPDNLTVGLQLVGAGKLASAAGKAGFSAASRVAPYVNRALRTEDNALNQYVDVDARRRRDMANEAMDVRNGLIQQVTREGASVLDVAEQNGVDAPALSTTILNSLDQRFDDAADVVERLEDEAARTADPARQQQLIDTARRFVDDKFKDRPEQVRPTYEGIKAIIDYRRDADPKMTQAIVEVSEMLNDMAKNRTDRALAAGLNPEQTGTELLTPVVDAARRELELERDKSTRGREKATPVAARALAIERAQTALNNTIPEAPRPADWVAVGKMAEQDMNVLRSLRQKYNKAIIDLNRAVTDYLRAEARDGANNPTVRALERELDALTDDTVALEQQIRDQQRQLDAAVALSKASGEVETVDVDGNPVDPQAAIQREMSEIAQRPEPDLSNMTTTDAIETVAREVVDEIRAEIHAEIDQMTAGERPRIPGPDDWVNAAGDPRNGEWAKRNPKEARRPGQFDWYESLSANDKRVLVRDGWLAGADRPNMASPDEFTRIVNAQTNKNLSIDQAIDAYLELVEQSRELRARGAETRTRREKLKGKEVDPVTGDIVNRYSPPRRTTSDPVPTHVVETVAERMQMSPEVVRAALDGGPKVERTAALKAAFGDDVRRGYDELKAAWDSIEPEMKESIYATAREIAEEGGDLFEYIVDVAENYGLDGRDVITMYGATDVPSLWAWLEGADPTVPETFVRAVTETPGPAQKRLIARMQATLKASKAALRERYSGQRSLRRIVDRVRDDADARVEDAAGRVDAAEIQMDAAQVRLDEKINEPGPRRREAGSVTPRSLDGWKRHTVVDAVTGEKKTYKSRFEADRVREGRAINVRAVADRTRKIWGRNARRMNDKIANLDNELGRSAQARLIEDINAPAVRGYVAELRKAGPKLGTVIPPLGDVPAQLTGLMDKIARSLVGREGSFRVAALMHEWGSLDSVEARYDSFLAALEHPDVDSGIIPDTDHWRDLRDSMMAERAIEAVNATIEAAGPTNLNLPWRVRDVIRRETSGFSQDARNALEDRFERYDRRRNKHLRETFATYQAAMPKRMREVAREALEDVRVLLDMAEDAINSGDGYLADILHRMAEQAPTNLQMMVDRGIDPVHLVGGKPVTIETTVRDAARSGGIGRTKTRGSKQSKTGGRPESLQDVVRLEISEQATQLRSETVAFLKDNPALTLRADAINTADGSTIGQMIDRSALNDADTRTAIVKALAEEGWAIAPWETGPVHRGSRVVPQMVIDGIKGEMMGTRPLPIRALSVMNHWFKVAVLAAAPLWQIANVIGGMYMSVFGLGKMSVLDMPRLFNQALIDSAPAGATKRAQLKAFWEQGGLASWAPDELATHGLSFGEHELIRRAWDEKGTTDQSLLRRAVGMSYRINEFADNSFRSIMFADQMQKMSLDPKSAARLAEKNMTAADAAVKHTLRALGDFTNMTAFEKRYVREVFPFYAWLRHQTLMTLRMPVYSPMRTAYLIALSDQLEDEDFANEFYGLVGSKIPLGGGNYLNLGGMSPFITPWNLPLDPTNPAAIASITPAIRVPFQIVTGKDINQFAPTTRPYDERPTDLYGRETSRSPLRNLLDGGAGEIGYLAAGALPQTKMARDFAMDTNLLPGGADRTLGTARYGSGQRVGDGEYDSNKSALDVILAGTRLPRPENMEDRLYDLTQQMLEKGR